MHSSESCFVIVIIKKRGIKLAGVNTGEKRVNSAGFEENHVICSCSSTTVHKLIDFLTAVGVTDVEIGE